jgi:nucleotide-binding universal stress UspA family protein
MNPGLILIALAALMLAVAVPVALAGGLPWRRPWRLTCPRTGTVAQIRAGAARAAVGELLGRPVEIERCSLWPELLGCRQDCLALSVADRRRTRRGEPPPRVRDHAAPSVVVVPLDGEPGSEAVLPAVAELARAHGAAVRLLRVVKPGAEIRGADERVAVYADQESARLETEARDYMHGLAARMPDVTVAEAVRVGDVIDGIVAEAEAAGADIIAMASHRRRGVRRLVRRSVARRLQQATTIPLLLAPYGARAAR